MPLSAANRRRIEEFVRPLYVELDGVQTFDRVARLADTAHRIAGSESYDDELLELLTLFHGVVPRLGSLGPTGRFDLFLRGLELPQERRTRLRRALGRFAEEPEGVEESLVHDALLLDETGVRALLGRMLRAGRRRQPLERALGALDPGPDPGRYRTAGGARLAAERHRVAAAFIGELERSLAAEAAVS